MAKSKAVGPNKSQAIREALAQKPQAKVSEIVAFLATRGIKVQPQLVYFVKAKGKARARRVKSQEVADDANGQVDVVALLTEIKSLAAKAGGIKELKKYVDVLAE